MKNGLLERIMKGKKSPPGTTAVDQAVAAICDLESQVTVAGEGLHQARQALERAMADAMVNGKAADHTGLTTGVLEAQARLNSAVRLLESARAETVGLIDAGRPDYREAVSQIEAEIKAKQQQIGRKKAEAIAHFCHLHGLTVKWPSDFHLNGGMISLPVMALGDEVYREISASAAERPKPPDPHEAELAGLRDKLLMMQTLAEQPSAVALDQLVARAQRKRG